MYDLSSINAYDARELLDLIVEDARIRGEAVSIAIADIAGNPLMQYSMPGAALPTYAIALHKVQTAIYFGRDTVEFGHTHVSGRGWTANKSVDLVGDANRRVAFPDFVSWAGAALVRKRTDTGQIQGAVAVSGLEQLMDHERAESAIKAWRANSEAQA